MPRAVPVVRSSVALLLLFLSLPGRTEAYAPHAAAAIASRIPDALPPAALWDVSWSAAAAAEVERLLEAEDSDLETHAPRHRFVAGDGAVDPGRGEEAAATARVVGHAPYVLAGAAADLTRAFRGGQASLVVRRIAELAISAADLADPFLTTAPEAGAVPALQARYSDLFETDFDRLPDRTWTVTNGAHAAGIVLGEESARRRTTIEDALRRGDHEEWSAIRDQRLGAALSLARTLTLAAWQKAVSPSLEDAEPAAGKARVWPNPAQGATSISFSLPGPMEATLELFDLAGRRVWSNALGPCRSGPQQVTLAPEVVRSLSPGLYLTRVSAPAYAASGRLVRLPD